MDLPNPDPQSIRLAIQEIEKINLLLGGFNQTLEDLKPFYKGSPLMVQDWGCGSGDLLRKISQWAKKKGFSMILRGYDNDPETIDYAKRRSLSYAIDYECLDIMSPILGENSADIVCSCLFTHHFKDEDWIPLIKKMVSVCRKGVIVNDLHRHWFAYYSIKALTRLFAKSYMVRNDAALSVAKGFKRKELVDLLIRTGIKKYEIRWKWAFRWSIVIYKDL
jgi:2-polyprenyl-3-methyl-5-hydroxy-6-metoxy-1,4-benzoquinol methylase